MNCSWVLAPEPLLDTDFVAMYRSVGVPEPWLSPPPSACITPGAAGGAAHPSPSSPLRPPRHSMQGAAEAGECVRTGPRSCSFGDVQMFSLVPYVVNVTAVNPLGAASALLPFLLENISECHQDAKVPADPSHPPSRVPGSNPALGVPLGLSPLVCSPTWDAETSVQ